MSKSNLKAAAPVPAGVEIGALEDTICGEIRAILQRPMAKLPVHKDLPRLASSIFIYTAGDPKTPLPREQSPKPAVNAKRCFVQLAQIVDPTEVDSIKTLLDKHLSDDEKDVPSSLVNFFVEKPSLNANNILKACNQAAVAPAVVNLQLSVGPTFPYTDAGWTIHVRIFPSHVLVEHVRHESLTAPSGSNKFTWVARMILDQKSNYSASAVSVKIVEIAAQHATLGEDFKQAMKSLYAPTCSEQTSAIFAREWIKLPIAKDMFHFAGAAAIKIDDNETIKIINLLTDEQKKDSLLPLKPFLLQMSKNFNPSIYKRIKQNFDEHVTNQRKSDMVLLLRSFLGDFLQLGGSDPFCRALKVFTKTFVSPIVIHLQLELRSLYPFKDGGAWDVTIHKTSKGVSVVHEKSEVTLERTDPAKTFDFLWRAEYSFDKHLWTVKSCKFSLVKLHFPHKATIAETQTAIKSLLELVFTTA